MAIWEYKVISSGKGGFATPVMLEKFLNDLGKDEWEVIEFTTPPENPLAFHGLARRSTQRDWTLGDAAAAAAKVEADKIRAEFEAKFKGISTGPAAHDEGDSALADKVAPDDGYRSPVDTSRDQDHDADEEPSEVKDEWEDLVDDDDLPTFFEAIRPHMRRNQRGPGVSVGVDQLAKNWGFDDEDILTALKECGFEMPEDEDTKPAYLEYDGDLFWVNINRRGEIWINTKEKPMPVFRIAAGKPIEVEEDSKSKGKSAAEKPSGKLKEPAPKAVESKKPNEQSKLSAAPAKALPKGEDFLAQIRPKMRRNRHDAGHSGSMSFLSRALKCTEADLQAAFMEMGLAAPVKHGSKPVLTAIGAEEWWLNHDQRGGVWINGREQGGENDQPEESTPTSAPDHGILTTLRPLLKAARNGASADLEQLAEATEKSVDDLVAALVATGLHVPEKPRQKTITIDQAGESFWLSRNTKDQVLLNAKPAEPAEPAAKSEEPEAADEESSASTEASGEETPAEKPSPKKSRRPRPRKRAPTREADSN